MYDISSVQRVWFLFFLRHTGSEIFKDHTLIFVKSVLALSVGPFSAIVSTSAQLTPELFLLAHIQCPRSRPLLRCMTQIYSVWMTARCLIKVSQRTVLKMSALALRCID